MLEEVVAQGKSKAVPVEGVEGRGSCYPDSFGVVSVFFPPRRNSSWWESLEVGVPKQGARQEQQIQGR